MYHYIDQNTGLELSEDDMTDDEYLQYLKDLYPNNQYGADDSGWHYNELSFNYNEWN